MDLTKDLSRFSVLTFINQYNIQIFVVKAISFQPYKMGKKEDEERKQRNDVDQSLIIENDVEMRTETVENTNSLRENTETEIVITDIRNMSNKYHKTHEKVSSHQFTKYHQNAMIKADEFLKSFESLDQRVENQLSDCKLHNNERN